MSTNCIGCGLKDGRTGHDMLCDTCRAAGESAHDYCLPPTPAEIERQRAFDALFGSKALSL
jgi:hypothetical protein